ncbi:hypothetical protein DPEC_G00158540 [Dallia pectoralis]|uniref:Uncharacterized protein n=1 Tax=Dallia pectoralis TaxID=75939 RepID=A0ACC2GLQ4_DALPE|nr:hypothetical protein DPEC_G00158540 [Dallia pectoralis]
MRVHFFGNSPSPAVAIYGLRRAARDIEGEHCCEMAASDTHEASPQGPTSNLPDLLTSTEFRALCSSIEARVASIADTVRTTVTDAIVPLSSSIDAFRATVAARAAD